MNLRRNQDATRRRGVILLVVLAMLTLFAIAGITFVLYANASSESARISRDAESYTTSYPDMDPTTSLNFFLAQFIYGVSDNDTQLVESSLRGHSLAETMYGSWDAIAQQPPSDAAFNGTGRLHETAEHIRVPGPSLPQWCQLHLVPERRQDVSPRSQLPRFALVRQQSVATWPRGTYTGGQNAPYTYPDVNNMFLATLNTSTGQIATPSFLRSSVFGSGDPTTNSNWTNTQGKYLTLRPRPQEMSSNFPFPDKTTGCDVQNSLSDPGGLDSIWMDIGSPGADNRGRPALQDAGGAADP